MTWVDIGEPTAGTPRAVFLKREAVGCLLDASLGYQHEVQLEFKHNVQFQKNLWQLWYLAQKAVQNFLYRP
jgi:hypothetical protein